MKPFTNTAIVRSLLVTKLLFGGVPRKPFPEPKTPPKKKPATSQPATSDDAPKPKKAQTYREAWRLLCQAPILSKRDATAAGVAPNTAQWIADHVRNKKARYFWIAYGKLKPELRPAFVRREVEAAGQTTCPLEAYLFRKKPAAPATPPKTPASPPATAPSAP